MHANMCLLRFALLGALIAMAAPVAAQQASQEARRQLSDTCKRTIDEAMVKLHPGLIEYPELKNKSNLVLLVPAADFNAFANYESRQILIPVMWCIQTWFLVDAHAHLHKNPQLRELVNDYTEYLRQRQNQSILSGPIDQILLESFDKFARVDALSSALPDDRKLLAVREGIMVDSLAFVLGHEIGHLALNHKRYTEVTSAQARKQEDMADEFAAKLLGRTGISIIPSMFTLVRFLQSEADIKGIPMTAKTHPRAECRMQRVLFSSGELDQLLSDPARRREFERGSTYSVPQFRRLMQELRVDCAGSP
ncbi:MAG TPA: ImmA/IrrE family metallo-endopeptidase [Nitrospira sp.]|nr:ImmA/IrrE family metallo-endopeptidase [Nitrospira sp.]